MKIQSEVLKARVIGKHEGTRGFFFKQLEYTLAIELIDERVKRAGILERDVSFGQYSQVEKGDVLHVKLYTYNRRNWFASREEAEFAGGILNA